MWSSRISHVQTPGPTRSCASVTTVARTWWRSESFHAPPRQWLETLIPFRVLRSYTSFQTRQPVTAVNCDNAYMSDGGDTDEALMLRFAGGDVRAFEELYRRHELKVWRYLQRNLGNRAISDELMQDVWFAVARAAAGYRPSARFTTWLLTLAHNRLVDALRATRHHERPSAAVAGSDALSLVEQLAADSRTEPLERAQSQQHAAAVLAAIERLPLEQRQAFLLHAEGELTLEEIARVTSTNFETAKSRLRYARSKLRQLLQEYA
jgi:RNA polymerase sigma factor (sigma-70 family)